MGRASDLNEYVPRRHKWPKKVKAKNAYYQYEMDGYPATSAPNVLEILQLHIHDEDTRFRHICIAKDASDFLYPELFSSEKGDFPRHEGYE